MLLARWSCVFAVGLVLLTGRYDWSLEQGFYARRGFLLSAYLLVLTVPLLYYLLRHFCQRSWIAPAVTAGAFLWLTLPYRWLGLDDAYYYRNRDTPWFTFDPNGPLPKTQFLPDGPLSTFPYDVAFFAVLALLTLGIGVFAWTRAPKAPGARRRVVVLVAVFAAILVQTFLHSGVRAPYVYMTHFQEPEAENFWYAVSLFDDGSATVIADQFVFSAVEDTFHGAPRELNNMLIRRPLSFYIVSQFSYFTNTYYPWIAANILMWFGAVLAGFGFVKRLVGHQPALLVAAMITSGTGFVAFVGTPAMYLQNYATIAIVLFLFESLVVSKPSPSRFVLFAAGLGACSLIYDLVVLYPVLVAYGIVRHVRVRPLLASLAGAYLIYRGFLFVHNVVLDIAVDPDNAEQADDALRAVIDLLCYPSVQRLNAEANDIVATFGVMLARMYFVLPIVPAVVGIRFLRGRPEKVLVAGLVGMCLATVAALRIGNLKLGEVPRFVYPCYLAVYLLASLALTRLGDSGESGLTARLRRAAPWCFVGLMFVLSNVDSLGFPRMYYEALQGHSPAFLP